jgi:hypothetical protein
MAVLGSRDKATLGRHYVTKRTRGAHVRPGRCLMMAPARSFCVALRDITAGQPRRWASLDEVIARLGMDRREAGQLVARLSGQGMLELAEGDRLRLTEKGRRATGASSIRRLSFRLLRLVPPS